MVYLDHGHIISSLGEGSNLNFQKILEGKDGFNTHFHSPQSNKQYPVGKLKELQRLDTAIAEVLNYYKDTLPAEVNWKTLKVIVTTTKGGLRDFEQELITDMVVKGLASYDIESSPLIISNACVSGVMGIIHGANLINAGLVEHVLVIGVDFATDFVLEGFESLHALSEEKCRPFDENRKGINLSDCIASVFLTKNKDLLTNNGFEYLGGASGNDANHISGPSRTGEGLYKSVSRALRQAGIAVDKIDYINAHGTATNYNDEMESIAFERLGMAEVPINSLKGFFGHTLGAAGVLEVVLAMQQALNDVVLANNNLENNGVSGKVNLIKSNTKKNIQYLLKTSSGFGGINSSLILKKCS